MPAATLYGSAQLFLATLCMDDSGLRSISRKLHNAGLIGEVEIPNC